MFVTFSQYRQSSVKTLFKLQVNNVQMCKNNMASTDFDFSNGPRIAGIWTWDLPISKPILYHWANLIKCNTAFYKKKFKKLGNFENNFSKIFSFSRFWQRKPCQVKWNDIVPFKYDDQAINQVFETFYNWCK